MSEFRNKRHGRRWRSGRAGSREPAPSAAHPGRGTRGLGSRQRPEPRRRLPPWQSRRKIGEGSRGRSFERSSLRFRRGPRGGRRRSRVGCARDGECGQSPKETRTPHQAPYHNGCSGCAHCPCFELCRKNTSIRLPIFNRARHLIRRIMTVALGRTRPSRTG